MLTLPKHLYVCSILSFFEGLPNFVKVNLLICSVFFLLSFLLITVLFFNRFKKNKKNIRKEYLTKIFTDFMMSYLFDEDFDKKNEIKKLKNKELITDYDKRIIVTEILNFYSNLKGESSLDIKHVFKKLELDSFTLIHLKSSQWQNIAKALFVFSELSYKVKELDIEHLLNNKNTEVRQQYLLYILKHSHKKPLEFLNRIERPLTLLQIIYIENSLKNDYLGEIPDFSNWLNHKFESVIIFSIRMIGEFNQFENITKLEQLLLSENNNIRTEVIRCLSKMGHADILTSLILNFKNETLALKIEILDAIKEIGSYDQYSSLSSIIKNSEEIIRVKYNNMQEKYIFSE